MVWSIQWLKWGHPTVFEIVYWDLLQKSIFSQETTQKCSQEGEIGTEDLKKNPFLSDSSQLLNSNSFSFNSSSLEYKADIFLWY